MDTLLDLQASLPKLKTIDFVRNAEGELDLIDVEVKPHSFVRDGYLYISMEHGDGAGSYSGKYINEWAQDGIAYINPVLEAWATANKGYWEWHDGGSIVFSN
jgi:hypothetical protein